MNTPENEYAVASERDRFLASLDHGDLPASARLAINLTGCGNPLPSSTCRELGLPVGSSYGSAARHVILSDGLRRAKALHGSAVREESQASGPRAANEAFTSEAGREQS